MVGGGGTDTLRVEGTADVVLNGTGSITGIEIFDGGGRSLRGTGASNVFDLSGFTISNLTGVLGLGGNDILTGSAGSDILDGGVGVDVVSGGGGDDMVLIRGTEAQADTMVGGDGTDTLRLEGTADVTLNGTGSITGFELLDGGGLSLRGTSASDVFDFSGFTISNLTGVLGLGGNDTLTGSAGDDTLDGGAGVDLLIGGGGDDTFRISGNQAQTDTMDGGSGQDQIMANAAGGDVVIESTNRISGVERFDGAGVAIRGTNGADVLDFSGIGELVNVSSIQGRGGADTLAGGNGDDVLTGGGGNDAFMFRFGIATGNDRITDFDAAGNDVIRLLGYSPAVNLAGATSFDAEGALIDLSFLGGDGSIRLSGVVGLSFTSEDFVFA
jgi:Ca2+-binding RTX toxin-like protein